MTRFLSLPRVVLSGLLLLALAAVPAHGPRAVAQDGGEPAPISVDDFETYTVGTFPDEWVFVTRGEEITSYKEAEEPGETIEVREEDDNQFVRFVIENEAVRYTQRNGHDFDWSLERHPRIAWQWRALHLPEGASERGKNDSGAALYITFGSDWLGRPKSIKYTYSTTLSVGTVVDFGPLKAIVVDSGTEPGMGTWKTTQRNVANDYRQVFGGDPPNRPVSITLWSDSDTTHDLAKVDFDNIRLLPPYRR